MRWLQFNLDFRVAILVSLWIPAFAGMTWEKSGITVEKSRANRNPANAMLYGRLGRIVKIAQPADSVGEGAARRAVESAVGGPKLAIKPLGEG